MNARSGSLIELIATVGEDAARRLRERFGGTSLYIPRAISDDHAICRTLGRAGADKLIAWAGGTHLSIPMRDAPSLRVRVVEMRDKGFTKAAIALACNMSERHVYRLLAKAEADDAA